LVISGTSKRFAVLPPVNWASLGRQLGFYAQKAGAQAALVALRVSVEAGVAFSASFFQHPARDEEGVAPKVGFHQTVKGPDCLKGVGKNH